MSDAIVVVIDTNVLLSAVLYPDSIPQQALEVTLQRGYLLFSEQTKTEFQSVLMRSKFDRYLSQDERLIAVNAIFAAAIFVEVTVSINDCRDPKDNKFLEAAVSGHADFIISGDKDLTILHPYHGISILTPAQFLEQTND